MGQADDESTCFPHHFLCLERTLALGSMEQRLLHTYSRQIFPSAGIRHKICEWYSVCFSRLFFFRWNYTMTVLWSSFFYDLECIRGLPSQRVDIHLFQSLDDLPRHKPRGSTAGGSLHIGCCSICTSTEHFTTLYDELHMHLILMTFFAHFFYWQHASFLK